MTRYAEHASPKEVPLYEFYPRPMMFRNHDGRNLAGLWDFAVTDLVAERNKATLKIVVAATLDASSGARAATGIFRPAWIESVRASHIDSLAFVPDLDASTVRVTPTGTCGDEDVIEVVVFDRSFEVARAGGKMGHCLTLKIANSRPWTPDMPFLYEYRATIARGKQTLDSVFGVLAVRKVSLGKGEDGRAVFLLNNQPCFLAGILDAGWWPDGGATAPYYEAIRRDVEKIKQLGFNTVRKPLGTDQEQWYFWADRLGLMVLQELPPGDTPQLLRQYPRIIADLFNHPSIVAWVLPRDASATATRQLAAAIRAADPTRLVLGGPDGDLREIVPADVEKAGPAGQATILSPLGDVQSPLAGHAWTAAVAGPVELTANYLELGRKMAVWKRQARLSEFIYKQLADVADDYSGLLSSDRLGIKLDLEAVAGANLPWFAVPQIRVVVPSGAPVSWTGADFRAEREFTLDTAKLHEPWVVLRCRGDADVALNGGGVAQRRAMPGGFELVRCGHGVVGRNVLFARGHAEPGKGRLAVGLVDLRPQLDMRLPPGIKPMIDTWMRDPCVCLGPDGIYYLVGTGTTAPWKCDGIYYLSVTDSKMPYKTYDCMVGMSDNVYGPYKKVHFAVPHGGHNMFFTDKQGNWWSTLFGGDAPEVAATLNQQPGLVRIEFAPDGTIHPLDPRLR
jgi:hypothetical protein